MSSLVWSHGGLPFDSNARRSSPALSFCITPVPFGLDFERSIIAARPSWTHPLPVASSASMKRRTRLLKTIAMESLTLAVEVFSRPSATARTQGVLLNLQHSFEMLLKAVIWEDRGRIQPKGGGESYSLRYCLRIARGIGRLSEDEEIVAATIAGHRDAVQHQGAAVTDERLYLDAASGLRLFDDLLHRCFSERLADHPEFANRMLPVTANPPSEMHLLTSSDVQHSPRPPQAAEAPARRSARAACELSSSPSRSRSTPRPSRPIRPNVSWSESPGSSKKPRTGRRFCQLWPSSASNRTRARRTTCAS